MSTFKQYGNDVSKYQGKIDWAKAKAAGCKFAILRAGYGAYINQKDPTFDYNHAECVRLGIPCGAYWYAYWKPGTINQEIDTFLQVVGNKELTMGLWYDVEYEPFILGMNKTERTQTTIDCLEKLRAANRFAGLYASTDMINNLMDYDRLRDYDIWVAQYGSRNTCKIPYGIWQYSSTGRLDGINGNVDTNWMYVDYPSIIKAAGLADGTGVSPPTDGTDNPDGVDPEPTNPNLRTLRIGPMTSGDIKTIFEKAIGLKLYVAGTLDIGPMSAGDYATFEKLAKELNLESEEL